tara:strand:+ start:515 stop:688 length:174 start_codon:yes stop_codon:yes gene_type:complete
MHLVIEVVNYEALDEKYYYVRFSDVEKVRCEAWIDSKKNLEAVEGNRKDYEIFSLAS